jgi:hypothetical protein
VNGTVRRVCLALIGVLYVVSVPWYRESGEAPTIWLGLPDWVAVAVLCYVGVAVLNAFAWTATEVDDELPDDEASPRDGGTGR